MNSYCKFCEQLHSDSGWIFQKDPKSPSGYSKRCRLRRNFTKQNKYSSFNEYLCYLGSKKKSREMSQKERKRIYDQKRRETEDKEKRRKAQLEWSKTAKGRACAKRANAKRTATPEGLISSRIRAQMYVRLKSEKPGAFRYLPYSAKDLKRHLESKFQPGMTWKNRNLWHIDHVIALKAKHPDGKFYWDQKELGNPESSTFREAWSLNNLQPLWKRENIKKSNKLLI